MAQGIQDLALARVAPEQDIFIAPGLIFFPNGTAATQSYLRLNVGYADDDRFPEFMRVYLHEKTQAAR